MKQIKSYGRYWCLILCWVVAAGRLMAQGTAFTYQGQLASGGGPATGLYDVRFALFNAAAGGSQAGGAITNLAVGVTNGLFTTTLNFGPGLFTGTNYWLALAVRTNDPGSPQPFTSLSPLQPVTPVPYALFATAASNVSGTISAAQITGPVASGNLAGTYSGAVTLNNAGNSFTGNGANLTALNAGNLTTGTIADARLSANVALLNGNQTFSGANSFAGTNASVTINTGPFSTNYFSGLGFQYDGASGEGAIQSSFNDGFAYLSFYTKQGSGYPMARQVKIDRYGVLMIDQQGNNNGVLNDGTTNGVGLTFGPGSGEGIASDRNSGVNVDGLDFYTGFNHRLSILNNGRVGIGLTNPATALQVNGTVTATTVVGDGSGLTNLNATQLGSGTIPLAQLPGSVALLTGNQTFAGVNTFAGTNQNQGLIVVNGLAVDQQNGNNGVLNDGTPNGDGLTFGNNSGEGIASDRNSGVNQNGLDFYTGHNQRLSILHNGKVGIGLTNPATALQVNGTVTATALVGDGSGLTNISTGQLPSSVALLNANQTFTGLSTFSGPNVGLIVNTGPISTNLFTGLGFEYNSGSGEGAILSSYNDNFSSLTFYTKQGSGYPLAKQVKIDRYGTLMIDQQDNNNGVLNDGTTNGVGLTFGTGSGEGIASDRNAGVNLNGLDFYTSNSHRMSILNNGKVGIGLTNPATALQVNGTVTATAFAGNGSGLTNLSVGQLPTTIVTNNEPSVSLGGLTLTGGLELPIPASISAGSFPFLYLDGNNDTYLGIDSGDFNPGINDTGIGDNALGGFASGSQNTALGNGALYFVSGSDNTAVGNNALESSSGSGNTAVGYDAFNNSNPEITLSGSGNIGIGNNAGQNVTTGNNNIEIGNVGNSADTGAIRIGTPGVQTVTYLAGFVVCPALQSGLLVCTGGVTAVTVTTSGSTTTGSLTITGGSDLAEPFAISTAEQPVAEGSVVVIDEANPGQLKLTDQPYDTRVAGVVSGANGIHPGIQMHQQGLLEGGRNVALTGRVYVQADTSNGAIKPGDLLTTSGTPGRAMRVSDHARAQGAILGKAMTALPDGQGMVLVLVTLQ